MPGSESPDSKGRKQQSASAPSTIAQDQEGPPEGLQVSVEPAKPEDALDLWNLLSEIAKESKKHKIYENKIIFNKEDEEKRVTINKAANGSISFNTETPATSKSVNEVVGLLTKLAAKSKKPITFTINDGSLKHVQKLLKKLESSDVRVVFSADYIKKLQRLSQTGTVGPWGEREIAKQLLERHRQQSLAQQRSSVLPMSEQAPNATSVAPNPANSLQTPGRGMMRQAAAGGGALDEQTSSAPATTATPAEAAEKVKKIEGVRQELQDIIKHSGLESNSEEIKSIRAVQRQLQILYNLAKQGTQIGNDQFKVIQTKLNEIQASGQIKNKLKDAAEAIGALITPTATTKPQ